MWKWNWYGEKICGATTIKMLCVRIVRRAERSRFRDFHRWKVFRSFEKCVSRLREFSCPCPRRQGVKFFFLHRTKSPDSFFNNDDSRTTTNWSHKLRLSHESDNLWLMSRRVCFIATFSSNSEHESEQSERDLVWHWTNANKTFPWHAKRQYFDLVAETLRLSCFAHGSANNASQINVHRIIKEVTVRSDDDDDDVGEEKKKSEKKSSLKLEKSSSSSSHPFCPSSSLWGDYIVRE